MLRSALQDLAKVNRGPLPWSRALRFMFAVGAPLLAGLVLGGVALAVMSALCALLTSNNDLGGSLRHRVFTMSCTVLAMLAGGTVGAYADAKNLLPLVSLFVCGFFVGWMHGTSLVIENLARYFAIYLVVAVSLKVADPVLLLYMAAGGACAIAAVLIDYSIRRVSPPDISGTWRKGLGVLRSGKTAGWRFAICYAAAVSIGLLLGEEFGARRAGWVSIATLLVMRPDGGESLQLVLQRILGTLIGVTLAGGIFGFVDDARALTIGAWILAFAQPLCSAFHRWIGIAVTTALVLVLIDLTLLDAGGARSLLTVRLYDTLIGCVLAVFGTLIASANVGRSVPPVDPMPG